MDRRLICFRWRFPARSSRCITSETSNPLLSLGTTGATLSLDPCESRGRCTRLYPGILLVGVRSHSRILPSGFPEAGGTKM